MQLFLLSSIDAITDDPEASFIQRFIREKLPNHSPKIAYIQYSSDADLYAYRAMEFYKKLGVVPTLYQIDLDRRFTVQAFADLAQADILHIPGGNTFDLIRAIRIRYFTSAIHDFINSGRLTVTASAGALILGPSIGSARLGDDCSNHDGDDTGMHVINFEIFPHWNQLFHYESPLRHYSASVSHPIHIIHDHEAIFVDNHGIHSLGNTLIMRAGKTYKNIT